MTNAEWYAKTWIASIYPTEVQEKDVINLIEHIAWDVKIDCVREITKLIEKYSGGLFIGNAMLRTTILDSKWENKDKWQS
jgi:hypothetical protein